RTHRVVAAPDRHADPCAELTALGERTAPEHAATGGVGSVEPERERDAVAEQEIGLAATQRLTRGLRVGIGTDLDLREERLEIGFMRRRGDHGHLAALEPLRTHGLDTGIPPLAEARRRAALPV